MKRYLFLRVMQAVAVVVGVSLIVFIIIHLLPGGPRALLGPHVSSQQVQAFMAANGYDKSIPVQYITYIRHLFSGNLGFSYHYNESVATLLRQNLPKSGVLVGIAIGVSLIVAIPIGLLQAFRRNGVIDYALTGAAFIGYSMPVFWLATLLILNFGVKLHLLPPEGPQGATVGAVLSQPSALVMPVATLSIVTIALFSRYMRSSAVDSLVQDYIRTARSKGASERRILARHVLRNSVIPIMTLVGLSFPTILSGAVITETVFNYPGMGLLFWNAATSHDYPTLMGVTIVVGVATVVGSLVADILYAVVDPRVRYA